MTKWLQVGRRGFVTSDSRSVVRFQQRPRTFNNVVLIIGHEFIAIGAEIELCTRHNGPSCLVVVFSSTQSVIMLSM